MQKSEYIIETAYKKYLIPMVVSSVSPNLCASIDKAIVGNMLGENALAAVGLVMPVTVLISVLSLLFSLGGSNICTLHNSRGESRETNHTFTVSIVYTLIVTAVIAAAGLMFLNPFVRLLGADELLFESTRGYTQVMLMGLPVVTVSMSMDYFLRVDGSPNMIVAGMLVANITNIILDVLFIRAGMGVAGAALASVMGYTLTLVLYALYFFSKRCSLRFIWEGGKSLAVIRAAVYGGMSSVIQFAGWLISIVIINKRLSAIGGPMSLSVYAVVLSIMIFTASTFNGVINAMTPVVGTFYGDRDYPSLRMALKRGIGIAYLFGTVMALLYWIMLETLIHLFGVTDPATLQESVNALRLVAFGIFFQIIVGVLSSYYQATEKPGTASIISFTRAGVLQPLLPLFLTTFLGVNGVYASLVLLEVGGLLAAFVGVYLYRRKNPQASRFLLLEPVEDGREFKYSLKNDMKEIPDAMGAALAFCRENQVDEKRSYTIGLAIEEMSRNIIEHGLSKEKKAHYIDIRVKLNGDQIILRIRDDGTLFDPTTADVEKDALETLQNGERLHLGLRLVSGMAKKMEYTRVLGFNNTVVYT